MVILDRLNFRIHDVHVGDFEEFNRDLERLELLGAFNIYRDIGDGASDYKYELRLGRGDGAVYIGYQHNSVNPKLANERFDMKIEFNPNKHDFKANKMFWVCLKRFIDFKKSIKSVDLAFDFPYGIDDVIPVSLTGKELHKYRSTLYYGERKKHGHLKVYDKVAEETKELKKRVKVAKGEEKERLEKELEEKLKEKKTRIEYTVVFADPVTLQVFRSFDSFGIDEQYAVTFCDLEKFDDEIQCYLYCIKSGFKALKDFKSRRKREKIKKALQEVERVSFDSLYRESKKQITDRVKKCLNFEWDKLSGFDTVIISEGVPF